MRPARIQLKRTKGWRLPENTIVVSRPSKFGNPFTIASARDVGYKGSDADLAAMCVDNFREWLTMPLTQSLWWGEKSEASREAIITGLDSLKGKNLSCWCKPGAPCHAEVLLELANKGVMS